MYLRDSRTSPEADKEERRGSDNGFLHMIIILYTNKNSVISSMTEKIDFWLWDKQLSGFVRNLLVILLLEGGVFQGKVSLACFGRLDVDIDVEVSDVSAYYFRLEMVEMLQALEMLKRIAVGWGLNLGGMLSKMKRLDKTILFWHLLNFHNFRIIWPVQNIRYVERLLESLAFSHALVLIKSIRFIEPIKLFCAVWHSQWLRIWFIIFDTVNSAHLYFGSW